MQRPPDKPPEVEDLPGLEARVEAWLKHCGAEYTRAETKYSELHRQHCMDAHREMDRWGEEYGKAMRLLVLLKDARSPTRTKERLAEP